MHKSIFRAESLPALETCQSCCRYVHCPLCPAGMFKPTRLSRTLRHIEVHIKNALDFEGYKICKCNLDCRPQGHFHCPQCSKTIIRRDTMIIHLKSCRETHSATPLKESETSSSVKQMQPPSTLPPHVSAPAPLLEPRSDESHPPLLLTESSTLPELPSLLAQRPPKVQCPFCSLELLKKNLPAHISRIHGDSEKDITKVSHLYSVCIDATNGISAVQRARHGFSVPIHAQKKTWGKVHSVECELEECKQFQLLARRSGLTFSNCEHIRSLEYCTDTAAEELLQAEVLEEMVHCKILGESRKNSCLNRQRAALKAHVPFSVQVQYRGSSTNICLSICEPQRKHYSRFGRVMVTYNTDANTWHCPCARPRVSCIHKSIGKWHLFQTKRDLFKTTSADSPHETSGSVYPPTKTNLERVVQYIYKEKKVPAHLPAELFRSKPLSEYATQLIPMETRCVFCTEHPSLEKPTLITDHARIVGLGGIVDNVSTFFRTCPQCHMVYRYQEWQAGLHNFNDHTVLTLELCIFLRHNLQNHVSVSRAINSLEGLREVKYPSRDTVLHAYCQFEAMTSHDYVYSCINCGYYPPVVIMDLHKKGVFSMAVSDIKDPPEQFKGEHNIEEFWDSVNLEMIARGFVQSRAKNPLAVYPSFDRWAPWIGGHTRKSDIVLNTEYQKLSSAKATAESELVMVTEERLVDELRKQKVGIVRKLCKACNIDSKGSRDDLILRLRNEMKNRHSYDKVFQKIWGASGGWAVIACPHGIVYSLKFNLRAESPRDFADLLMSWKHLPNVSVYDFARGLTTHTNLRFPDVMPFQPNEGRLAECTPDNITAAQKGKLEVSLSWLLEKKVNPDPESHPTTGSSCHFALYDKFHESNTKDQRDVLRRINLVPELQGWLNSQVVEQLFGVMKKNNYFLNNMAPSTHVFMMRNIIHHRNVGTNQQLLDQQLHKGLKFHHMHTIALNEVGQAVLKEAFLSSTVQSSTDLLQERSFQSSSDMGNVQCGLQCEALTTFGNIKACRSSWTLGNHPNQEKLLSYVLDSERPGNELIVRIGKTCLTREDFLSLGTSQDMEATIGNCCFELITEMAKSCGKDIFIADLYVVPTWLPPHNCDPMLSLPNDAPVKDLLLIPIWVSNPGHFMLCVLKPAEREMLFLDSQYSQAPQSQGFRDQTYKMLLSGLAKRLVPGHWTEKTGLQIKDLPGQPFGNDCGIFMLMYALYIVLDAPFDFSVNDMALLRKWWCVMLMENFALEGHGKRFAHWTEESKALLRDDLEPVFRLKKHRHSKSLQESAGVTKDGPETLDPVGVSQHEEPPQNKIVKDMQEAISWIGQNEHVFKEVVQTPDFLQLGEEDAEEALTRLRLLDSIVEQEERDYIQAPFTFRFGNQMDMELFLREMVDTRKLHVYTVL